MNTATTLIALCAATAAFAGPLTPPPGAVAPTGKTTEQIEPRTPIAGPVTISQPGNYYLTGDISIAATGPVITVNARDVTIDLNGFEIDGGNTASSAILCTSAAGRLTVTNGRIQRFAGRGIDAFRADSNVFRNLSVSSCETALYVASRSIVEDCTIVSCPGAGIVATVGAMIRGNQISIVGSGIVASSTATIENNRVETCSASGIEAFTESAVVGNLVTRAAGPAIEVNNRCRVESNTIATTFGDGISAVSECEIVGNTIADGGDGAGSAAFAGVRVTGAGSRVDSNRVSGCGVGYSIFEQGTASPTNAARDNIIVRNVGTRNANGFFIGRLNAFGEIIDARSRLGTSNGFSATGTVVSTDPWANINY